MAAKTKDGETVIAYWLVPAKPEREFFNDVIRILGGQMKAPRFEPHITIFAVPQDRHSPKRILEKIKAAPLHFSVRGIGTSSEFRKSLFVRLRPSKALQRLVVELRRATKSRGKPQLDPHLSLLYKKMALPTRRGLASMVKLPFSHILFDSIKAVRCVSPLRDRADIKKWRVIATKSLK